MHRSAALPLCVAVLGAALVLAGCGASILPRVTSETERLEEARKQARQRDWLNAIELLKTYIDRNAGSADVDEAIYLLGMCYIGSKEFPNAAGEFERLLRDFPESDSAASASFRLGQALFGQARPPDFDPEFTHKALDQWERYRREFPGHWLQDEADRRIAECRVRLARKMLDTANLYYKLKQIEPARVYYKRVEAEYADTPLLGDAIIGIARCDALEGRTAEAVAYLKDVELMFKGQPLGQRAEQERKRIERMGNVKPPKQTHILPPDPPPVIPPQQR
jgi:outer membrane assembly lipoprotein YfiO